MPRVVVIGPPGSGKTTVAKELSRSFGLSHIELDAVLHGPDGIESSDEDFLKAVLPELESDRGLSMDGMSGNSARSLWSALMSLSFSTRRFS